MLDLYIGLAILAVLSLLAFALSAGLARSHHWVGNGLAIGTVLLTFVYIRFVWDNTLLATVLPYSNLVVLGNWFPLAAGFLAGVVWSRIPPRRRLYPVLALFVAAAYSAAYPLLGHPPQCRNTWYLNTICLQTTPATCTPACAATLLKDKGIETSEAEMARLCLTRDRGTNWTGLYRGLKLQTEGTDWTVTVIHGTARELLAKLDAPVIIAVGIPFDEPPDSYYRTRWIWNPGEEHSVLLGPPDDKGLFPIVDPDPKVAFEKWTRKDILKLWRGQGMLLVPRDGSR